MTSKPLSFPAMATAVKKVKGKMPKLPAMHRLITGMTSAAYHGTEGTWSSSQLKVALEDEELFIKKYVHRTVEKEEAEHFDTGTYFHTGVLEPHLISKEIAVYPGKVRAGNEWKNFRTKHAGKCIITEGQKKVGDGMIKAVQASPTSMEYLVGQPEVSLFIELVVFRDEIYAPFFKKKLSRNGWVDTSVVPTKGFKIVAKVRSDCLGDTFISDLKSTSGRANKEESVRKSVSQYKYDLSAAFYLDMFSLMNEEITAFIWVFASKENPVAKPWKASKDNILIGRAKWSKALKRIADMSAANWEIVDSLGELEPQSWERDWLIEKDKDLL